MADFERTWRLGTAAGRATRRGPRLVAFLGSHDRQHGARASAPRSCPGSAPSCGPGDTFLLGTDLVKDPAVLVAAYDDSAGVTAAFNKNVLAVLNAELGADFDLDAFDHVAVWDARPRVDRDAARAATAQQVVQVPAIGLTVRFAAGEEMRTEVSAKFRRPGVERELAAAGFAMRSWWTDRPASSGCRCRSRRKCCPP